MVLICLKKRKKKELSPYRIIGSLVKSLRRCSTVQCSAAQHSTARHGTARHGTARRGAARHGTARHTTPHHTTPQCSAARRSAVQCRFNPAQSDVCWDFARFQEEFYQSKCKMLQICLSTHLIF